MENLPLTLFDIIVLVVIAISLVVAFMRGFVSEVLSLFAWGGAVFATLYGLPLLRPFAHNHIKPNALADTLLVLALAIVSLVVFKIAASFIGARVRQSSIGALDRMLGVLFGLFRGLLVVCIAYIFMSWIIPPKKQPDWIAQARTRSLVEYGANFIRSLLPAEFAAHISEFGNKDEVKNILRNIKPTIPTTTSGKGSGNGKGYDNKTRESLDRLIKEN